MRDKHVVPTLSAMDAVRFPVNPICVLIVCGVAGWGVVDVADFVGHCSAACTAASMRSAGIDPRHSVLPWVSLGISPFCLLLMFRRQATRKYLVLFSPATTEATHMLSSS